MGRTLNVALAVSRDEASRLRETAEKQREKKDTRNLYLLREGGSYGSYAPNADKKLIVQ